MRYCSVPGCKNSLEEGYYMKHLPKDPGRRHEWLTILNCSDSVQTSLFYICEVHFEPHMWERTRLDGTRRLKLHAKPSISPVAEKISERYYYDTILNTKPIKTKTDIATVKNIGTSPKTFYYANTGHTKTNGIAKRLPHYSSETEMETETEIEIIYIQENNNTKTATLNEDVYTEEEITETSIADELLNRTNPQLLHRTSALITPHSQDMSSCNICESFSSTKKDDLLKTSKNINFALYEKTLKQNKELNKKNREMTIKLRDLQREVIELRRKLETRVLQNPGEESQHSLLSIFNKDQIVAMNSDTKFTAWSDATIEKALRLKYLCGIGGYKELLKQNIPLPSLRTLHRREVGELKNRLLSEVLVNNNKSINFADTTI